MFSERLHCLVELSVEVHIYDEKLTRSVIRGRGIDRVDQSIGHLDQLNRRVTGKRAVQESGSTARAPAILASGVAS